MTLEGVDSPTPTPHGISQHDTELTLAARFVELGGVVERGKKLESLSQDDEHVAGNVVSTGGAHESIEAKSIVGCDGAHSVVRKQVGFTFEGAPYEERIVQADVHIDWGGTSRTARSSRSCTRTGRSRRSRSFRTDAIGSSRSSPPTRPTKSRRSRCSSGSSISAAPQARRCATPRG